MNFCRAHIAVLESSRNQIELPNLFSEIRHEFVITFENRYGYAFNGKTSFMRDLGDFQTPPALVEEVLRVLGPIVRSRPRVLEPTCGQGNFIAGLFGQDPQPREIYAFELTAAHADQARTAAEQYPHVRTVIKVADIFDVNLSTSLDWAESAPLLVVGNPPWVTNAELSVLGSSNIPVKKNWRKLRGIEAMTGLSNFDLAECVWIKILVELAEQCPTVAMLCKTSVARNVLRFMHEQSLPMIEASLYRIDAQQWFSAVTDACLLVVELGSVPVEGMVKFYPSLNSREPDCTLSLASSFKISDPIRYAECAELDGTCPLQWRQGIKHDAARIMELKIRQEVVQRESTVPCHDSDCLKPRWGTLLNGLGETVDVEPEFLYPLLKGSDLFHQEEPIPRRLVIVTQKTLSEDTGYLKRAAPKLWAYLRSHERVFKNRKSAVFSKRPGFSLFGVGEYSFAPYKIAVPGLYKEARFRIVKPIYDRPVMVDDTCYCIACSGAEQAALIAALLNHPLSKKFLHSIVFRDAKRPITKAVLQRVDLKAALRFIDPETLLRRYAEELRSLQGSTLYAKPTANGGFTSQSTYDVLFDQVMRLI